MATTPCGAQLDCVATPCAVKWIGSPWTPMWIRLSEQAHGQHELQLANSDFDDGETLCMQIDHTSVECSEVTLEMRWTYQYDEVRVRFADSGSFWRTLATLSRARGTPGYNTTEYAGNTALRQLKTPADAEMLVALLQRSLERTRLYNIEGA